MMSDSSAVCTTGGPPPGSSGHDRPVVRETGAVAQLSVDHADPHPVDEGRPPVLAAADGRRLVPVLTYHSVSDDPPEPIRRWSVTPARLRAHLTALRHAGFTGLTVTELLACYRGTRSSRSGPSSSPSTTGTKTSCSRRCPRWTTRASRRRSTRARACCATRSSAAQRPGRMLDWGQLGEVAARGRRDRGAQPHAPRAGHPVAAGGGLGGRALGTAAARRARAADQHVRLPVRLLEPRRPGGRPRGGLRRGVRGEERLQPRRRRPLGAVADPRRARSRHRRVDPPGHPARPADRPAAGAADDRRLAHLPAARALTPPPAEAPRPSR